MIGRRIFLMWAIVLSGLLHGCDEGANLGNTNPAIKPLHVTDGPKEIEVKRLGAIVKDQTDERDYRSSKIKVEGLMGGEFEFLLVGYHDELDRGAYDEAIENILSISREEFKKAELGLFDYYQDIYQVWKTLGYDKKLKLNINQPSDVWDYVDLGPWLEVRRGVDGEVYVLIVGECDWEVEHGVEIVLRNGKVVNRVGVNEWYCTNEEMTGRKSEGLYVPVPKK